MKAWHAERETGYRETVTRSSRGVGVGWYLDSDPCQSQVSPGGEEGGLTKKEKMARRKP